MAFQLSPGVSISEVDLTSVVPSVATSIGAFAGPFSWGPVNEVVTISDEVRLADRFGKPTDSNYEYWFSAANFLAYSNNLKVVRAANNSSTLNATANGSVGVLIENETDYEQNHSSGADTFGVAAAKYAGAVGNSLKISICPSANAFSSNVTVQSNTAGSPITASAAVTGQTTIGLSTTGIGNFMVVGDSVSLDGGTTYIRVTAVEAQSINIATPLTANVTVGQPILRKWEYAAQFALEPGTSDYGTSVGAINDEMHIIIVDEDGVFTGAANTAIEKFAFVSKASDAKFSDGSSNYYKNVLNKRSRYTWWLSHPAGASNWGTTGAGKTFTNLEKPTTSSLGAGANGTITNADLQNAYAQYVNGDTIDISLVVSGPADATIADYLISNLCEVRKDCMVFLSPLRDDAIDNAGSETTDIVAYRDGLTSSSFAVMDSAWKYQFDKYNDVYRWVPMNGDVAGLCVRTDKERDPWFSPAGLNRGVIKNVIKLSWNPSLANRDALYVKGINPIVTFQGEGTLLYGDKTMLARPSVFDRINVRRLFIVLEKSIAKAARSSLFEFNDQFTRAQFVALIEPYLRDVQGRRGITDFRVVCDDTNNPPAVVDANQFIGDIYIKPTRSINFIQLNFVAVRTGVSFEEVVGQF
jgi:phage tail sheath protein FI